MEQRCEIDIHKKIAVSTSQVDLHNANANEADVPLLSITAPSEEVSDVEDTLGSSASQTPGRENAEEARSEAERIVDDVLTQASEILQSQTSPTFPPLDNSVGIAIYSPSDDNSPETEDERQDNSTKDDTYIRNVAHDFVTEIIEKALEEVTKRLILEKEKQATKGSRENLLEVNDAVETMSSGSVDKRHPWYRRARTSASKLLNRLCVCGRANR